MFPPENKYEWGKNRLRLQAVLKCGLLQFLPSCVQGHIGLNGIGIQLPELITGTVNVPAGEAVAFPGGRFRNFQKLAVHLILGSHIGAALGIKGNGEAGVAHFQSNHDQNYGDTGKDDPVQGLD